MAKGNSILSFFSFLLLPDQLLLSIIFSLVFHSKVKHLWSIFAGKTVSMENFARRLTRTLGVFNQEEDQHETTVQLFGRIFFFSPPKSQILCFPRSQLVATVLPLNWMLIWWPWLLSPLVRSQSHSFPSTLIGACKCFHYIIDPEILKTRVWVQGKRWSLNLGVGGWKYRRWWW